MFTIGPLDVYLTLDSPRHGSSLGTVSSWMVDLELVARITNRASANHDIELDLEISPVGLLEFAGGAPKQVPPPATVPTIMALTSAFRIIVPVYVSAGGGRGTVSLTCRSAKYKQTMRPRWSPPCVPPSGNTWTATVT